MSNARKVFKPFSLNRRQLLKGGAAAGAAAAVGLKPGSARAEFWVGEMPTSPLITKPFTDPLPVPGATLPKKWAWDESMPHDSVNTGPHRIVPTDLGLPAPITYEIPIQVAPKHFTSSPVLPIDSLGQAVTPPAAAGTANSDGTYNLPPSCIYGFNGAFPGARINAEYGKPVIIRFKNELDYNPDPVGLPRQDFGAPNYHFLTHLHNGHTSPESDGNPHYMEHGYGPGEYSDNLYLNYPPENNDLEKQSFLWFHDHQHSHTGANVYKGMVGLFPIYDPKLDNGDETRGLRLPGVRTNKETAEGLPYFDVEYDIPLAFYDLAIEDGVTPHGDYHVGEYEGNLGYGQTHAEWWGKQFFQHIPDKGFVGDIFTVNCTAFPVLEVKRRKYRLRMLGASISRIYTISLMKGTPKAARDLGYTGTDLQGQYRLTNASRAMDMMQIATDGGLIPTPIRRQRIEIWPAKRREFVVDFTRYADGTATKPGDAIYLVNTCRMSHGVKPDSFHDPEYIVPMMKIVIGETVADNSVMPTELKPLVPFPYGQWKRLLSERRVIDLVHSGGGAAESPEYQWQIRYGKYSAGVYHKIYEGPFNMKNLFTVPWDSYEVWQVGSSGGWSHPMHIHQDEHQVMVRDGKDRNEYVKRDQRHADDASREDVIALGGEGGEDVIICKDIRTTWGQYVAHCHQLAHEDHAMMFAWAIGDPPAGTYKNQSKVTNPPAKSEEDIYFGK